MDHSTGRLRGHRHPQALVYFSGSDGLLSGRHVYPGGGATYNWKVASGVGLQTAHGLLGSPPQATQRSWGWLVGGDWRSLVFAPGSDEI